jgi:nitroreductase
MKLKLALIVTVFFAAMKLFGQTADNCLVNTILSGFSERAYTTEPVTDEQLDLVLKCGIKSPSAHNNQPWRFTVIRDEAVMKEVVPDVVPGNVLIVVSGLESEDGITPNFDCALATENMFIAAHALGLGARIYGGPVGKINTNRTCYQIPSDYKPVMVLRIGNADKSVDAVTAATPRMSPEEIINYFK